MPGPCSEIANILAEIATHKRTGCLHVQVNHETAYILDFIAAKLLHIRYIQAYTPAHKLGYFLLKARKISKERFKAFFAKEAPIHQGALTEQLHKDNIAFPEDIQSWLYEEAVDQVGRFFLKDEYEYHWRNETPLEPPKPWVPLALPAEYLLLLSLKRHDVWKSFNKWVNKKDLELVIDIPLEEYFIHYQDHTIDETARAFYDLVEKHKLLKNIQERILASDFHIYRALDRLLEAKIIVFKKLQTEETALLSKGTTVPFVVEEDVQALGDIDNEIIMEQRSWTETLRHKPWLAGALLILVVMLLLRVWATVGLHLK
jgi:hypothetical protein